MGKYYVVIVGRKPGIYEDWATAKQQIDGFPGALHKSFPTKEMAEAFIEKSTISPVMMEPPIEHALPDKTVVYTDGSYKDGSSGFGVVILAGDDIYVAYGHVPLPPSNNVAELYAIYVALSLCEGDVLLYTDSRYSISCLTTYIHDWAARGWVGVANSDLIRSTYDQMKGRTVNFQYVPGHMGYTYNEECDRLAEAGRIQSEPLIILKNNIRQ